MLKNIVAGVVPDSVDAERQRTPLADFFNNLLGRATVHPVRACRLCVSVLLAIACGTTAYGTPTSTEVGARAPDFCLPATDGEQVCLHDFKDKDNVVLLFYVLDFTPG